MILALVLSFSVGYTVEEVEKLEVDGHSEILEDWKKAFITKVYVFDMKKDGRTCHQHTDNEDNAEDGDGS